MKRKCCNFLFFAKKKREEKDDFLYLSQGAVPMIFFFPVTAKKSANTPDLKPWANPNI